MSRSRKRISLIVDASVARAASGEAVDPRAHCGRLCRQALEAIRNHERLGVAFSPRLWEEWKRNRSRFSSAWLTQMYGRKKVDLLPREANRHDGVERAAAARMTQQQAKAVHKDSHLVAAALQADLRVISLDDRARDLVSRLCNVCSDLGRLYWASPCAEPAAGPTCVAWLEGGAPGENTLKLCP